MRVLFVRHGAAEDRSSGGDLARHLTQEGRRKAEKAFRGVAVLYPELGLIVSSEARRARETAELLAAAYPKAPELVHTAALNPGATFDAFRTVMRENGMNREIVAVVGHEPDFSYIISAIISNGAARIHVKKASCIEVEANSRWTGELKVSIPAGVLARIDAPL